MPDVCPPNHTEYGSEFLGNNAVTLHRMKNPYCEGVMMFPCGDHFHVGHTEPAIGQRCKANAELAYQRERGAR